MPRKRRPGILCKGKVKEDGKWRPCKRFAVHGAVVCDSHGARARQVKSKAALRAVAAEWTVDNLPSTCKADNAGEPCGRPVVPGTTVCEWCGGNTPQVRRRAIVRAELLEWGLTDTVEDPGTILLRLVSQSSRRVALYADLLEQQYAKSGTGELTTTLPTQIGVLIGRKYSLNNEGRPVPVEEAIRGLVQLEMKERELCASFASKAIAAGLAERQVRNAERMGAMMADMLRAVLGDPALGLSAEQRAAIPGVIRARLSLVD